MKIRLTQFVPTTIALLAIGFRYSALWCIFVVRTCYGTAVSHISLTIIQPLYFFALFFLPMALVLIFIPRIAFNAWLKFAAWAVPLAVIYIALTPVNSNAFMDLLPFYRDDAARLAGGVFAGASLILIIWKYIAARRRA